MYLPAHFAESDAATLHRLLREYPLATLITLGPDGPVADHLPLLLDPAAGPLGTLRGHVARANPVWRTVSPEQDVLAIFHGPDAYITPDWYPGKHEHGKAVPTWNYVVVHVHGRLRVIDDRQWLHDFLSRLTAEHEAGREQPWQVADAPADYIDKMLGAVVGIELEISRLQGKAKVSQNQPAANRQGVAEGLRTEAGDETMARWVEDRRKGEDSAS